MKTETLIQFIASQSHETRRIPDPYNFFSQNGKLILPSGEVVEDNVDISTSYGCLEYVALQKIQDWANKNETGVALWFSPPLKGVYPASKFIISELQNKTILNRAVVLDIDGKTLLSLANQLVPNQPDSPEQLRSTPIFVDKEKLTAWLDEFVMPVTTQVELIYTGQDLRIKAETLATIADLANSVPVHGSSTYNNIYYLAKSQGLIGSRPESCPVRTAFQTFASGEQIYPCNCHYCHRWVNAKISFGKIHCPECGMSAPSSC